MPHEGLYNKILATKLIPNRPRILDYIIKKKGNLINYYKLENLAGILQKILPDLVTITDGQQFMQYKVSGEINLTKEICWVTINMKDNEESLAILLLI